MNLPPAWSAVAEEGTLLTTSEESHDRRESLLDPGSPEDWEALRLLAHEMVDEMLRHLRGRRETPAWQPLPCDAEQALSGPLPRTGEGAEAAYRDFLRWVLPYGLGNTHPRFWGWVNGTGTPLGMLADMLAAGLNPNVSGFQQAPVLVERQVIRWLAEALGYPTGCSGLLVSGGSESVLVGLAVGRSHAFPEVRAEGLQGMGAPLVVYTSTEAHSSIEKAVETLGIGRKYLRRVSVVASDYTMDVRLLAEAVDADTAAGLRPAMVVATAGTVNTGACDDLARISSVCRQRRLWLHVDGAFGAWAAASPRLRHRAQGLELADSLSFDLHKWMYLPYDIGCVLVRRGDHQRSAFAATPTYLAQVKRGVAAASQRPADMGVQLSRGFRALKVWLSLKAHGMDAFSSSIERNVDQAQRLAERIAGEERLQLMAPVPLNVVCFRYLGAPASTTRGLENQVNEEILVRLQEGGTAVLSSTSLGSCFCLRAAIVNHRTQHRDLDMVVDEVLRLGDEIVEQRSALSSG